MTWPPLLPAHHPLAGALRELLFSQQALSAEGAGVNLVEALVMVAESADRLAAAIEGFRREES